MKNNADKSLVNKSYKLGGMGNVDSPAEIKYVMTKINGVEAAEVSNGNVLNVTYDQNTVQEGHIISTLSSLGHSILENQK